MFAGFLSLASYDAVDTRAQSVAWSAALAPYRAPDREGCWSSGPACLFEQRTFNAASNRDEQVPRVCSETGVALAFWGRLDNRASLATALDIPADRLVAITDSQLVLAAWRRWDTSLPEKLLGDFALAVIDATSKRVFLARDALGVKPLYYVLAGRRLVFATSVAALRAVDGLRLTPDPDWMARYLLRISMSDRQTAYREAVKLPPGHTLQVGADGREQLYRWHAWRDDPPTATKRDPRWVDDYRAVLEEAIRCRMGSDFPLGTENSGGLDSATITAYLAWFLGEPGDRLHSFGFALCEHEPAFILETSQVRHIAHNYIVTSRASFASDDARISRALRMVGYPEEHSNGSGHIPFYRECELRGIRTLFSGFGGDEVATHPGHHLRWELLDGGHYRSLFDILPGNVVTRFLRLGKAAVIGRSKPAYNPNFLAAWNERWPHQLLRPEVVNRLDLHHQYMETARYDAPFRRINDFILQHLLRAPYVATRLENCTLMAASYGIDYRWPLWDVRVVQQYLSTPSIEKVGPKGMGRYLHRCTVDHVVPKRVAWKPSKDMGYALLRQEMNDADLIAVAEEARRVEARLHPALDELIDRRKLRQQIARAGSGNADDGFVFCFLQGAGALGWLDTWLRGERAG